MSTIKQVSVSSKCEMCGKCEEKKYSEIFACKRDGTAMEVKNNGLVDADTPLFQLILEVQKFCPFQAIQIEDSAVTTDDKSINEKLAEMNRLVYEELRDYPFAPPAEKEYAYETGVYTVAKIPAQYRSTNTYRTYEAAEAAGVQAFKSAIWSQAKSIARQYIIQYRVKKLKKYYTYEEKAGNFYYDMNQDVSRLLQKAETLAKAVTNGKIKLPDNFSNFAIEPDWGYENFNRDLLEKLEDVNFDFEHARSFYVPDSYSCYVDVNDHHDDKYYYDYEKAEESFRGDMDSVVQDVLDTEVPQRVDAATSKYLEAAKKQLSEKLDLLQKELKKYISNSDSSQFERELKELCSDIWKSKIICDKAPSPRLDLEYNSDYRFYSERECEKAAQNRRERAYNDGRYFIERLPETLDECYARLIGTALTQWKRNIIRVFDMTGQKVPPEPIRVIVGDHTIELNLRNFDDVTVSDTGTVKQYVKDRILRYGYAVGNVKYISEYEPKINVDVSFDVKETIFGNIKEVNHRYGYIIPLHEFDYSAYLVGEACLKELNQSDFLVEFTQKIKESLIESLLNAVKV